MKHTILHRDAEAAAAFEDALRQCRDLNVKIQAEERKWTISRTERQIELDEDWIVATRELVGMLLAAAVVSSDELDAAEALLHGMRLAVPQDEMGQ